ncbi:MAG: hypothetical protein Q8903_00315 [Bacteroidota bacterium]|nr:hypothetical protein [Bacteroidota bacterium]
MFGINQIGTEMHGNFSHQGNVLIDFNYRYKIYEALKLNLKSITKENNFKINIDDIKIGDDLTDLKSGMIVITQFRDIAVIEYDGTSVNRNSFLIRSQTKLRNLYITFKLYVKQENISDASDGIIEEKENYVDEIIKGIYGYNPKAQQLKQLLFTGIQNDFGLIAYELSETKPYNLKQDLIIKFEGLFQYKLKYF